ncbi:hypothetical protein H5V45_09080 [Nocardioides sp. KIGAM211]|uniref:Uncharacterized protein n=1 Tax=Nocardioides luti TaxID=2761101 RepID=A0A7X0RFR9_9ACTN|nr:hypothetical protein [Nocardioides luti]MBB6627474.1 hypothetical protein [Nocardioides luti]
MPPLPHTALDQLTYVAVGYAALVTLAALAVAVAAVPRPAVLDQGVWILEALLVIRAVAGLGVMLRGDHPAEQSAYVGYLVASVCVLPIAMQSVADDRGRWSNAVITVAALAVTVIAVRLQMTLR